MDMGIRALLTGCADYLHSAPIQGAEYTPFSASIQGVVSSRARVSSGSTWQELRMEISGIDRMLAQLRTAAALAARKPQAEQSAPAGKADFANVLRSSLDQVNRMQQETAKLTQDFSVGEPGTNLHDVMISMQKSGIAFQQAVQVRNKLVQAYHDIMNMQV
jgi:flagellar hook-basal body complex protein FliE